MTGSGYIAASRDKMKSRFDSVAEQTGIFAGDGGFDITVGNHTQLDGAVIASTATADKNSLDTGTLGFSDIHNQADFKTQHSGINLSGGGEFGGDQFKGNIPGGMISAAGKNGHAEGTTQAAVADGTITIRDKKNQQQDVTNLSRDTEHANDSISPIFDKEKEQNRLQAIGLISEIGGQAADIARTQGELNAIKNAKDRMSTAESTEFDAARAQWQKENPDKTATAEDISNQLYQNYYNEAFAATGMGTGGTMQRGIQAATALAGSGNLTGALAGASAPELARLVKETTESNPAVNAVAHAVLGGVVAALQGNSATSGAAGAATGELVARAIADIYYPGVKMSNLTESQKQTISSLASVSAGIAGGIAGDSTSSAATGASAGKNAVENNALNADQSLAFDKELSECRKGGGNCQGVIDKWKSISDKQSAETDQKLKDNPLEAQVVDKEVAQGGVDMAERPGWLGKIPGVDVMTSDEAKAYVREWNGQDLANIDVNSPDWTKFAAFASDPENQAAVASLGMLGKDLVSIAKNTVVTKSLFKEMTAQGIKFTPENVVGAARDSSGKIIFLEKGNSKAGLQHIVKEHGSQFSQIGVSEARIPDVVMKAVTDGKIVGYQGTGTGRPIYETMINGKKYNIAVTVGNNGFIVGANLRGSVK